SPELNVADHGCIAADRQSTLKESYRFWAFALDLIKHSEIIKPHCQIAKLEGQVSFRDADPSLDLNLGLLIAVLALIEGAKAIGDWDNGRVARPKGFHGDGQGLEIGKLGFLVAAGCFVERTKPLQKFCRRSKVCPPAPFRNGKSVLGEIDRALQAARRFAS